VIVGTDGPAVVLSAETAYWLEKLCKVSTLRMRLRDGRHVRVSQELLDLRQAAMSFDPTQLPTDAAVGSRSAEEARWLEQRDWWSVAEAADSLGIGERAVRLACSQDRLDAERVGGRWRITQTALNDFKTGRTGTR